MVRLRIFGVPTPEFHIMKSLLQRRLDEDNVQYFLEEVTDIEKMMLEKVESIPSVIINQKEKLALKDYGSNQEFVRDLSAKVKKMLNGEAMKKIIVPIDFSPVSIHGIDYALQVATLLNAGIELMHVFMPPIDPQYGSIIGVSDLAGIQEEKINQLNQIRDTYADKLAPHSKITMNAQCAVGFPVEELVKASREADLIIIGARNEKGTIDKIFGSVSSEVARKAHCPVMVIPYNYNFKPIKQILYAFNHDSDQSHFLSLAKKFADGFDAILHIVHINEGKENLRYDTKEILLEYFSRNEVQFDHVDAESVIDGINTFIESHPVDLVIMVTKKRNFWESLFHHSATKEIALNTHVPLLVYHNE